MHNFLDMFKILLYISIENILAHYSLCGIGCRDSRMFTTDRANENEKIYPDTPDRVYQSWKINPCENAANSEYLYSTLEKNAFLLASSGLQDIYYKT